eukprot:901315-Rhodomonas_salina.1
MFVVCCCNEDWHPCTDSDSSSVGPQDGRRLSTSGPTSRMLFVEVWSYARPRPCPYGLRAPYTWSHALRTNRVNTMSYDAWYWPSVLGTETACAAGVLGCVRY